MASTMLTNAAIQYVMPAATIAAADRPAADALQSIVGSWGAGLVSVGMAVSICATFVGSSLSGARVPFAAAYDGLFFHQLAHVHPRFRYAFDRAHPSGGTELAPSPRHRPLPGALLALAIFAEWFFYTLTASTVFVFRRREPNIERPYSVWGYPVLPLLFIAAAIVLLVFSFADQPRNSIIGTIIILLGIPLHYAFQKRARAH